MTNQKLRIGLLIDAYRIPFWVFKMIEIIQGSNHSEIILLVKKEDISTKKESFTSKLWKKKNELFYRLYTKFEKKAFTPNPNALDLKNLKDIIGCTEIVVQTETNSGNDSISEKDIDAIKTHDVDVFIKLGFNNLEGNILKSSKFGVWLYQYGDSKTKKNAPPGVMEMLKKQKETAVTLLQLSHESKSCIKLYESFYETDNLYLSRNSDNLFWKSRFMVPKKLEELHRLGEAKFYQKLKRINAISITYNYKKYQIPSNWDTLKGISNLYWSAFKGVIKRRTYFEQWVLLFKLENTETSSKSFNTFERLLPPKDRFWADPFIIKKNDTYFIFIEELLYSENKGKISVLEMDKKGNYTQPKVVLETPYHLSYPFLIEDKGELYMLPETNENNTIELYKCITFPDQWELEKVLINNIKAVDSTIYKKDGKFWMFTNVEEHLGMGSTHELHIFYSDSLLNDIWIPHPENPVELNHNNARPAGNIFNFNGKIFRPAQDCSVHYGYGMKINEITILNENTYKEEIVQSIHPDWSKDVLSTHTLNHCGNLTFIDAIISRKKIN
ncbi:glucosamine inositolphosphorylceramide transferase family protein [Psychroserpens ponticola]|uniref:Glucosamine inositolphosphorylceramide transferase 1 N-terminal domain-containing protein n=1 Tax=Psychroserpens ponticola TaxID=2932268 RepID=A0ABY7S138_9FLAO|nr:hypothetical protein [Psychroserpens ponticola]WCO03099.1 hypothetical protein MUN68_006300 [Psychroserpens ponticola]